MQTDEYSLEAQKTKMKAFCDYNEYELVGEYEDAGKSGKSIEGRIAFNQMMDDIKSGKDAGKLMISVLSDVAEIERENIRVQTKEDRMQKAREGKWNGATFCNLRLGVQKIIISLLRARMLMQTKVSTHCESVCLLSKVKSRGESTR